MGNILMFSCAIPELIRISLSSLKQLTFMMCFTITALFHIQDFIDFSQQLCIICSYLTLDQNEAELLCIFFPRLPTQPRVAVAS